MSVQIIHSNFTAGELTPLLYGRVDFAKYRNGAAKIRNSFIVPQGGLTNRFGTIFEGETTIAPDDAYQLFTLNYGDGNKYELILHNFRITIYLAGILKADVPTNYGRDIVPFIRAKQEGNRFEFVHEDHKPTVLVRNPLDDTDWTLSEVTFRNEPTFDFARDYDNVTFVVGSATGHNVTLTAGTPFFSTRHYLGLFEASGTMRITAIISPTVVHGNIISPFQTGELTISGKDAYIGEPIFSTLRGWPKSLDFYQGRQWYGGTKSLKNGIFGSATFDAFNFDDSKSTASDSISLIISELENNEVEFLTHNKDLFVLTNDAEYSTPPFSDKPASPENTYFVMQNDHGVSEKVAPVIIQNNPLVIDKGGAYVRLFQYSVQRNKYTAANISILSPHLIRDPVSATVFKNPIINDSTFVLIVNNDGTMAIFQYIEDEQIAAWVLAETDGLYKRVAGSGSDVAVLVERNNKLYIERFHFSILMDSAKDQTFGSPQLVVGGLSHLNGKTVTVLADNFLQTSKLVSEGQITLDTAATRVIVGLPIEWEVETLPVEYMTERGNNRYLKKRIRTVYLDYYESLGLKIDGQDIPTLNFGEDYFGRALTPRTEIHEHTQMDGWERNASITISGDKPFRYNIRSITLGVEQ
ncbi:MAG: hypothetical protein V3V84_00730 [Candidatus Bathyarchaeia archaeon]